MSAGRVRCPCAPPARPAAAAAAGDGLEWSGDAVVAAAAGQLA